MGGLNPLAGTGTPESHGNAAENYPNGKNRYPWGYSRPQMAVYVKHSADMVREARG